MENYLTNFSKIYEKEILLHKEIDDTNIRLVYGEYQYLYIIDDNDIPLDIKTRHMTSSDITKYPHTLHLDKIIKFHCTFRDFIVYPYFHYKNVNEMREESFYYIKRTNYFLTFNSTTVKLIAKLEKRDNKYYIVYYFNSLIIQRIFENNGYESHLFKNILTSQRKNEIIQNELANLEWIMKKNIKKCNSDISFDNTCLKNGITLFNYQKDDVLWMKQIEDNVKNGNNTISYKYSLTYPILDTEYILYNKSIFPRGIVQHPYYQECSFQYKGGNLISEVGLGKTIVSLYYILSNDKEERLKLNHFVTFNNCCNYFFKRGPRKGMFCNKLPENENNLY